MKNEIVKRAAEKLVHAGAEAAPRVMLAGGILLIAAGTAYCCKETLKAQTVFKKLEDDLDDIEQAAELAESGEELVDEAGEPVEYTVEDKKKDVAKAYFSAGVKLAKIYWKPVALEVTGIILVAAAFRVVENRYLNALAAAHILEEMYAVYRKRVIDKEGVNADIYYRTGQEVTDEKPLGDGSGYSLKAIPQPEGLSPYAFLFGPGNPNYTDDPRQNRFFIVQTLNALNDKKKYKGHLFLNDFYEAFGEEPTQAGQMVGWLDGADGEGFIDVGLYSVTGDRDVDEARQRFLNDEEPCVWLDPNVEGIIWDLAFRRDGLYGAGSGNE